MLKAIKVRIYPTDIYTDRFSVQIRYKSKSDKYDI